MEFHDEVEDIYRYWKECESVLEQGINRWKGSYWFNAIQEYDIESVKMSFEDWEGTYLDPPFLICPQTFLGKFLGLYLRSPDGREQHNLTPYFSCYTAEGTEVEDIDGPVFLSEGVMDAEAIARFNFPSFACLKSSPSYFTIGMLDAISDQIVFVPDNDDAGESAKGAFRGKCSGMDRWIEYDIVNLSSLQDPGEIFQFGFDSKEALLFEQNIYSVATGW